MEDKRDRSPFPSFWISPDVNSFHPTESCKASSKSKHRRCNSGKTSPYKDLPSALKLKSVVKSISRKQSPRGYKPGKSINKSNLSKISKSTLQTSKAKKKKATKNPKKSSKDTQEKLRVLDKQECTKAPKIFKNQIFSDIYDKNGNHDRVMDTFEMSQSKTKILEDSLAFEGKFIIDSNLETEFKNQPGRNNVRQPENSFLEISGENIRNNQLELFQKLNDLALERNKEQDESQIEVFQKIGLDAGRTEGDEEFEMFRKVNRLSEGDKDARITSTKNCN